MTDEKKVLLMLAVAMGLIVVVTAKAIAKNEKEQEKITNETIKVLGEYRQYLNELAKNN